MTDDKAKPKKTFARPAGLTPDSTPEEDQAAIEAMSKAFVEKMFGVDLSKKGKEDGT